MNYSACYDRLIDRARNRKLDCYVERHHVVPKCLGGSDLPENIVELTPEEHFVAHQLLVKMHPGNHKLIWAASAMTNATNVMVRNNRMYGWLRRKFAKMIGEKSKGRKTSNETKAKQSAAKLGKKLGPYKRKPEGTATASKGKPKSAEHRAALSRAKLGKKLGPQSPEHLEKRVAAVKKAMADRDNSTFKEYDYCAKQSAQMKRVWSELKAAGR